ncbi:uncharacterized protein LOC129597211 [Paramacrobiotus metropolitanus]|uniref:uncharacterized protein LOC129597211 n=1 Tax=Paramacrobiotus metropolitanus TaxID=2943436 RepID=UPI00244642E6|nr:uncharacterized protein LOC129597211 [Paramacrobiotus metropolitanus]
MRRPSDKVPADTSTPDVIILKTSKKEGEAKGGKGAGAGKPKPGFFSRVLTKTDGVATATKEGESASGQTAESKAVKPVAPQSSSVSDKPTTSAPAVFKEPVVDVANFKKPNAPAAAKPAGVPGAPRLKPSQLEFHVTPHMIKIKHPYGTWSAWSNRQKIAAIRWLSAYPEGKEPGRLQEWQMPAEQWWPYFEDGAWIVPVAHRETGGAPVHEKVVTAEPLPIKAAVSGVQESVKGGEQEKKTEGGEEVDNAKTADKVVTATNVEDVKEAAPRESSPEFNTPVGNNTTDVEMRSGKAEKEGSGVISGKDGDEDEDVVLDSA